ncbi:mannosyl-3-phosphoglycerate synthase, partial [Lasiosphaeria miniovina]
MQEIRVGQLDAGEVSFDATLDGPTLTLPERLTDDISGGAYVLDRQNSLESEKHPHDDTVGLSNTTIQRILSSMVIIVPCKNEAPETVEGVLSGIPNSCVVILVSNSARTPVDRYEQEIQMLQRVCHRTQRRRAFAIHQKDEGVAAALDAAGMVGLTDPADGKIYNGKGEGMLLGVALAAAVCPDMQYVGFIDADNQVPGAVHEYCRIYAAGFALVPTSREHAMVRLRWASKPKVRDNQLCFDGEGRSSIFVNAWLNRLVKTLSRRADNKETHRADSKETNLIVTGNAGEHAMSMELALKLRMAGGYAVEPFHFIDLFQRQGVFANQADKDSNYEASTHYEDNNGMSTNTKPLYQRRDRAPPIAPLITSSAHRSLEKPVCILQIRTLNPHFHRPSDAQHIRGMLESGLGAIYH